MRRWQHRQRGFFMFTLVLLLLMLGATVLLTNAGTAVATLGRRTSETQTTLDKLSDALIHYTQVYHRLPCPANPNLATSDALAGYPQQDTVLTNPHAVCTYDAGVVPWKVLGLDAEAALDEWAQVISYRVYNGAIGLTQSEGASRVDCDTTNFNISSGADTLETPPISGQCAPDHNTLAASFISHGYYGADKGLRVTDYGTTIQQIAFVLISHGTSGLGAYLPSGARNPLPGATATDYPNTQGTTATFVNAAASDPAIAAGAAGHFDDLVKYVRIDDLLRLARLEARDWPEPPILGIDPTTTAGMDTAGTDHLLTQNLAGTREFQATSNGYAVSFGNVAGTSYASCLWSPNRIPLFATTPLAVNNVLAAYVEVAFDYTDAGGGLVLGFLPGIMSDGSTFAVSNGICGSDTESEIGWTNMGPGGTLPTPRFGIEIDLHNDTSRNDPPANHVAVNSGGVIHGGEAASCLAGTGYSGTSCYTSASATTLMNGLNHFHRLRLEVEPHSSLCSGTAPRLTFWLLPYSVCPNTTAVVAGTVWSSGAIAFRTEVPHRLSSGTTITVTGVNPSGYNGNYTVLATPTEITFTVAKTLDPGSWVAGGTITPSGTPLTQLSSASWSAGVVTFSTTAAHQLAFGNRVVITDVTPTDYNGAYTITGTTPTTFTVALTTDPGTTGAGGLVMPQDCTDIQDMNQRYAPTSFPSGAIQLAACVPTPSPATAFDDVYFGFTSNTIVSGDAGFNLTLRNLLSGLIPVP